MSDCHCKSPVPFTGPISGNRPLKGLVVFGDFQTDEFVDQVDVDADDVTVTLPENPRKGQTVKVTSNGRNTKVVGGCFDICGTDFILVPECDVAIFTFTGACVWKPLVGLPIGADRFGAFGQGEIIVPNIAALAALPTDLKLPSGDFLIPDRVYARVLTIDAPFELYRDDTEPAVAMEIVPALGGGNWLRRSIHVPKWTNQQAWFVDPANAAANDENDGNTPATALKTLAELCRRIVRWRMPPPISAGVPNVAGYYTITALSDIPDTDVFRPTGEVDVTDADDGVFPYVLQGQKIVGTTGVVGAGTAATSVATNTQAVFDAGQVLPVTDIGKLVFIPSTGAMAWISKSNGGNLYQVSQWFTLSAQFVLANVAPPAGGVGVAYQIIDFTSFGPAFLSLGAPIHRTRFFNLKFPATTLAEPQCIKSIAASFNVCRFQQRDAVSFGNGTFFGCGFDFPSLTELGLSFANFAFVSCSSLNASIAIMAGANIQFIDMLIQAGFLRTLNTVAQPAFGGAGGAGRFPAGSFSVVAAANGSGLGVFDAPAAAGVNAAVMVKNFGTGRIIASMYGKNPLVGFGLAVEEGSRVGILSTLTAAANLKIEGAPGQNIQLDKSGTAVQNIADLSSGAQAGAGTLIGGATIINTANISPSSRIVATVFAPSGGASPGNSVLTVPTRIVGVPGSFTVQAADPAATSTFNWIVQQNPVPLVTWAQWEGVLSADGFARNVVSLKTGAALFTVLAA